MKKLFFTVMAITAFSLTSFGNEIENKNVVEPIKEIAATELTNTIVDDWCVDVTFRWNTYETYYDQEYDMEGVAITTHIFSFNWCS